MVCICLNGGTSLASIFGGSMCKRKKAEPLAPKLTNETERETVERHARAGNKLARVILKNWEKQAKKAAKKKK